jgi:hypothetical protein
MRCVDNHRLRLFCRCLVDSSHGAPQPLDGRLACIAPGVGLRKNRSIGAELGNPLTDSRIAVLQDIVPERISTPSIASGWHNILDSSHLTIAMELPCVRDTFLSCSCNHSKNLRSRPSIPLFFATTSVKLCAVLPNIVPATCCPPSHSQRALLPGLGTPRVTALRRRN